MIVFYERLLPNSIASIFRKQQYRLPDKDLHATNRRNLVSLEASKNQRRLMPKPKSIKLGTGRRGK